MIEFRQARSGWMHVGIDQARQHGLAVQVDQFRLWALGLQDRVVGPNSEDTAPLDGERLVNREGLVHRDNLAVVENEVCLGPIGWLRCPDNQEARTKNQEPRTTIQEAIWSLDLGSWNLIARRMERDCVGQQPPDSI